MAKSMPFILRKRNGRGRALKEVIKSITSDNTVSLMLLNPRISLLMFVLFGVHLV